MDLIKCTFTAILFLLVCPFLCTQLHASDLEGIVYCSELKLPFVNPQRYTASAMASTISYAMFDTLLKKEPQKNSYNPGIAELIKVSPNKLEYTFKIRKGVKFHSLNGFVPTRELNADDVVFSFSRMIDPSSPFYAPEDDFPYAARMDILGDIKEVEKVSNHIVKFTLKKENSQFLNFIAMDNSVIISSEYGDWLIKNNMQRELLDHYTVGTGPYYENSFIREKYLKLKAFNNYYGENPKTDRVVITRSWKINKRLSLLFTGECQIISNPSPSQSLYISQNQDQMNLKILKRKAVKGTFLIFNTNNKLLKSRHSRRTIASLINIRDINEAVFYGKGHIIMNDQNQVSIFTDEYKPTEDEIMSSIVELKRSTLQIAVFENNTSGINDQLKTAEMLKSDLENAGLKIGIHYFRNSNSLRKLRNGSFDIAILNVFSDVGSLVAPLLSCKTQKKLRGSDSTLLRNFTGWCNPHLDQLFENLIQSPNGDNQSIQETRNSIRRIIMDEVPLVPLLYSSTQYVISDNIQGITTTPLGGLNFTNALIKAHHPEAKNLEDDDEEYETVTSTLPSYIPGDYLND